jgi:Zn-dependent protease with chaperone function
MITRRNIRVWRIAALGALVLFCVTAPGTTMRAQEAEPADATGTLDSGDAIVGYRLPPDRLQRAEALYRMRVATFAVGRIYAPLVLIAVLAWRVAPRFRDLAERASRRRFVQALVFVPLIMLSIDALILPLEAFRHHLQQSYGLSVQGWGSWLWDWTKREMVNVVVSVPVIWGLYAILRRSPTRWWLYGWIASIPVVLFMTVVRPIVIAPLFNTFDPLEAKQPELVPYLERVMERGGLSIERSRMFEMRASDNVTTYNAFATGIGPSKRVVVWDNTSRDLTIPETMFVFGHEQGHYVLNHTWLRLFFRLCVSLIGLYVAYRCIGAVLARFGPRWGVRDLGDWASLPVLALLFSLLALIGQPLTAAFSRHLEHQADIYGLEVIHGLVPDSPQVAARTFQRLGEKGLAYPAPHPLYVFWTAGHPPLYERLAFAADYRPWEGEGTTRYID